MLSLLTHPYIVGYYDRHLDLSSGEQYLFLEHCPGGTLNDLIGRGIP